MAELKRRYRGIFPVVPTTFDEKGALDLPSQLRAVDFMIDAGSDGLCILANFSEQFVLSDEERETLTSAILKHVAGRVPVIVTTTHYSSRICAERSRRAQDQGAAMVMIMPPYHGATFRVPELGIHAFFQQVSDAIEIPIMIQDAPAAGTPLSAPFLARMAREIAQVAYFKIETAGAAQKLRDLIRLGGDAIEGPWDGEEAITLLADLDAGATGSMTGGGYADGIKPIVHDYLAGDREAAIARYNQWLPLINYENRQCGLLACKALMQEGGVIACEAPRHPIMPLSPETRAGLLDVARRLDPLVLRWVNERATYERREMMDLTGEMLIGAHRKRGEDKAFTGYDAATGAALEPRYGGATDADVDHACSLAEAAFDRYRATSPDVRAKFLELAADKIAALGDALTDRACAETGLPRARIEGERGRTVGQLKLFAAEVREGGWQDARIDPALPDRKPLPRPDLRLRMIPLGPVAVFGASNFPLAFSVAGGDTASALAAGCPVVVKGHPAHPGTSEMVGRAVQAAVAECGLPEGMFSLLFGVGDKLGGALVADHRIKAVGFTGSRAGGLALSKIAAGRPEPIPVYAEMSSINPVLLLPGALAARGAELGKAFVGSLTMGAGQFCTNPGLLLAEPGPGLDAFVEAAGAAMGDAAAGVMLHAGILAAYQKGVARLEETKGIERLGTGLTADGKAGAVLFATDADTFARTPHLSEEVFGAAGLLVRHGSWEALVPLLRALEGQLTITIQMTEADEPLLARLLPLLETKAGRILVNGWPTGVEVSHAMVHGGPFPATSDGRTTSVGTLAIRRFLRPVCYQNLAPSLLPEAVADDNPWRLPRRMDGKMTLPEA